MSSTGVKRSPPKLLQVSNESWLHLQTKYAIAEALKAAGLDANIEHPVPGRWSNPMRIDVAVPSLKLAIEVRVGNTNSTNAKWKAERLEAMGWRTHFVRVDKDDARV